VSGHAKAPLTDWRICSVPPGSVEGPDKLERAGVKWTPVQRAQPVAAALRESGEWSLDGPPRRFDAEEWWYRASFPRGEGADEVALCFDGLATLTEVWLNGAPLLSSDNMFVSHERSVGALLADHNDVLFRFRSLDAALGAKRPRPRWRTPMVEHQQLRWVRSTLLGRTPGWSPPAAVVGPWRGVRVERRAAVAVEDVRVNACLVGTAARLDVSCAVRGLQDGASLRVEAALDRAGVSHGVTLAASAGGRFSGSLDVPRVDLWWPHTHGEPALYRLHLLVHGHGTPISVDLGAIGFREIAKSGELALSVNDVPLFCRGACWTPIDPVTLVSPRAASEAALLQVRDGGMNMLRVGGTMAYESDDFYDLADELGLLVWQDFMFANMDYPGEDPAFVASVEVEARQLLERLGGRPSLAVLCGNSEGEQQAAMWGAPRELWTPRLFHEVLPRICAESLPGVPYWPSSAHGGAFPHDATIGTTSYYGVGAYLRPPEDARRSEVRFASECLAFANVPATAHLPGGPSAKVHHPGWKARTPRDLGAGWDFDDVRDYYLSTLFGVDPMRLRYADHDRYLALGRVVTGELMARTMGEWRRQRSACKGALIWFLRDLWTGAGWGIVDASGRPKAPYHYLKRALQPIGLHLSDEGGSGLFVHVINERPAPLAGELELVLYRMGETKVAAARKAIVVAAHGAEEISAGTLFEGFLDLTYAYRFGPPSHDLVVATLTTEAGERTEAFYFPLGFSPARVADVGLTATARQREGGDFDLAVRTRAFAQSVALEVEGFDGDDDFFHVAPGGEKTIRLRQRGGGPLRGHLQPLNAEAATKITIAS
jgi:beta-mannosidase